MAAENVVMVWTGLASDGDLELDAESHELFDSPERSKSVRVKPKVVQLLKISNEKVWQWKNSIMKFRVWIEKKMRLHL